MKYYIKDESNNMYDVDIEGDYIISYKKIALDIPNRKPDLYNHYFQIKESLPSRFDAWIIDASSNS